MEPLAPRSALQRLWSRIPRLILAVPVRLKIAGIMLLPVLILGVPLNFRIRSGLSDWLSWILDSRRGQVAMQAGSRSVLLVTGLATWRWGLRMPTSSPSSSLTILTVS